MKRVLLLLSVLLPFVVNAETVEIEGLWYNVILKGKVATVVQSEGNQYSGDIVIPEKIEYNDVECTVTEIAAYAFDGCKTMTSVTIPPTITTVGDAAFINCNGLKGIYITDLSAWCNISFTKYGNPLFYAKHMYLNGQEIKELIIPESVKSIGNYAFENCIEIASVVISDGTETIGEYAFWNCNKMSSITIPSSLKEICSSAFSDCSALSSVHISDLTAWCNTVFGDNPLSIAGHLFLNNNEVKNVVVSEGVTSMINTFPNCTEITSVVLPNSLTDIGKSTFRGCTGLSSIVIPDNVTTIGVWAFQGCSNLATLTIGNSVNKIDTYAFMNCSKLTGLMFPNSLKEIGSSSFRECNSITSIVIPNSVQILGTQAFSGCKKLKTVSIGRGLKGGAIDYTTSSYFGNFAFAECESLEDVYCFIETNIPNKLELFLDSYTQYATLHVVRPMIDSYKTTASWKDFGNIVSLTPEEMGLNLEKCQKIITFADSNVKDILVPLYDYDGDGELSEGEVEYVNDQTFTKSVFSGNNNIKSFDELKYFTGLTKVSPEKFLTCNGLTSVIINEGSTIIGYHAFLGCTHMTSVTIPSTMQIVGDHSFWGCVGLKSVKIFAKTPPTLYESAIQNRSSVILYVPKGCKTVYETATYWKQFMKIIEMGDEITIGESGIGTFCSTNPMDFSDTDDIKAYIVSAFNPATSEVTLTRVANVPANTGIVVTGAAGTYTIPLGNSKTIASNLLVGVTTNTILNKVSGDYTNYILAKKNDNLGFYAVANGSTLSAGKAYLPLPTANLPSAARGLIFVFDDNETTTIKQTAVSDKFIYYDLQGRRVETPTHGIYIVNGKKVIINR